MFRRVSAAIVLASAASLSFAAAQAPKAKPVAPALPDQPNLITNASFEEPVFAAPKNYKEGGSPAQAGDGKTIWRQFRVRGLAKENEGIFDVGVTNQIARTGKQSVYVDLKNVTARDQRAYLMTDLMPVQAGYKYRVGIWGRIDKSRPLTLDQRRILMKAEMEFFTPATDENAGELESRALMIPGTPKVLHFTSSKWAEYATDVRAPRNAGWMKVTFRWETTREEGATDGAIYFDDASLQLIPGSESLVPVDPSELKSTVEDEDAAEETTPEEKPADAKPADAPEKK